MQDNHQETLGMIKRYMEFRGQILPDNAKDCVCWLVTEAAEALDASMMLGKTPWVRNNKEKSKLPGEDLLCELGDVYQMLTLACDAIGVSPTQALQYKMDSKGFHDRD